MLSPLGETSWGLVTPSWPGGNILKGDSSLFIHLKLHLAFGLELWVMQSALWWQEFHFYISGKFSILSYSESPRLSNMELPPLPLSEGRCCLAQSQISRTQSSLPSQKLQNGLHCRLNSHSPESASPFSTPTQTCSACSVTQGTASLESTGPNPWASGL